MVRENFITEYNKIRCPFCDGLKLPIIDRYDHMLFYDCPFCKGKGEIEVIKKVFNGYEIQCDHFNSYLNDPSRDYQCGWRYKYLDNNKDKTIWEALEGDGWSYDNARQDNTIIYCQEHTELRGLKPGKFNWGEDIKIEVHK